MPIRLVRSFLQLESASGIILFLTAIIAMIWANSPYAYIQQQFIDKFLFLINEVLMAVFFLIVGLELKRGYLSGQLSRFSQVILPFMAALGGMLVPAIIYYWINYPNPEMLKGWATPVATDIAFALGMLSLFGSRVPAALKLFLLVLAIFDDIGAILIIAFFYTGGLDYLFLSISIILCLILLLLNNLSVRSLLPYLFIGVLLWSSLFYSGIHHSH
jgi:NhaA family Na+:H+ antiporter